MTMYTYNIIYILVITTMTNAIILNININTLTQTLDKLNKLENQDINKNINRIMGDKVEIKEVTGENINGIRKIENRVAMEEVTREDNNINKKTENKIEIGEVIGEDGHHPCNRECDGGKPKICHYHFKIEWYRTMSKACYDCPYNNTDCERMDCVPADGIPRPIIVVNRKMPGPAIEVCLYDKIVVDVKNGLESETTSIHWHGMHQQGTPYMDGVPYVTQCPILPKTTFRYQFNASNPGTHFWHSHIGTQRADGTTGVLIVRDPLDHYNRYYDYDSSEHVMIVTDWLHELTNGKFMHHLHNSVDNKPHAILINGVGRFRDFNGTNTTLHMEAAKFDVKQDHSYRFRLINAGFLDCPVELSVDGHMLKIIASDGHEIQPIVAESLVTYAGERFDFIIEANNEVDNYWIKLRGHIDCDERYNKANQVAILHYEGAEDSEPFGDPTWEEMNKKGIQVNAVNKGEEDGNTICVSKLKSIDGTFLSQAPDYKFYLAYDFYGKNNPLVHKSPHYGFSEVLELKKRIYTPQFNHISMKLPSTPFLIGRPSGENFCNSSNINETCKTEFCRCPHVVSVNKNSVVELIIVDEGAVLDANHPIHLHGHSFRVLGMKKLGNRTTVEEVKKLDELGHLRRNLYKAPLKDTVTVPDGGYTIIRFVASNPGYWLLHCHIEFHVMVGMALVFKVGEHSEMSPITPNFPTCGNYVPDIEYL